jgi:hypothetical protein
LILALVVVLVGSVMSGVLIHMGYSFLTSTRQQRDFYGDHVSVTDYVQAVKGQLIQANIERGSILHGQGLDDELESEIDSIDDLLLEDLGDVKFSFEENVTSMGKVRQRVHVNVYDVHYNERQLQASLRSDDVQMKLLPAPINATGSRAASSVIGSEGGGKSPGRGTFEEGAGSSYPWDRFGAYVVRVQLFNVDALGRTTPVRTAEEAFYQVLSRDI